MENKKVTSIIDKMRPLQLAYNIAIIKLNEMIEKDKQSDYDNLKSDLMMEESWKKLQEEHDNALLWGKNKYYQPDLSELYVGYECEQTYDLEEYVPYIIDYKHGHLDFPQSTESIRSKYLDSDDIISLGFEEKRKIADSILYYKKEEGFPYGLFLFHQPNTNNIVIDNNESYSDNDTYFRGLCKSKNQLKKILSWIN